MNEDDRVKLLLIEDNRVDRMAFERFVRLDRQPYDYTLAESVAEARKILATEIFDIVLTDYHLGDGNALDVLRLDLEVPVVVITGAGDEETAIQAMRAGAFDYLIKDSDRGYLKMVAVTVRSARRHHAAESAVRMLSQAIKSINDSVFITDLDGRLTFVNDTFHQVYGYRQEEVLGKGAGFLWAGGETDEIEHHTGAVADDGEQGECCHRKKDGTVFPVWLSRSTIVDERQNAVAVVSACRDITERKRREQALAESRERYALAAAGANDGLWDWDVVNDVIYFSPRWKMTLGYAEDEIGQTPNVWFELVHPEDLRLLKAQIDAHLKGRTPHFENEHRMRAKDGEYRWVQTRGLAVRDDDSVVYRIAGSQRDITDRKRAEHQLSHAALHDALTGLPNRALFMDRLGHAVNRAGRRTSYAFGVIFLDLDRFKVVNDSLGHAAGDQLLTGIARRLEACLRVGDTIARLGGDEFAILLEDLESEGQVDKVAERIQEALKASFMVSGHEIFTTASLGIALSTAGYDRPEDILRDADTAMYRAKALGRTRQVVLFNPEMHQSAVALFHLDSDLRHAVERNEFEVHYQPILALESGRLYGFEALVRWRHPERGLVLPGDFLPLAIETGLSIPIGEWVLEEACRQLQQWHDEYPDADSVVVSVNLDAKMLSTPDFIDTIDRALERSGLDPARLQLELTEGMMMQNPEITTAILYRLREMAIQLNIDDFGTGYSSLSQLHRFPIDALKIDRSFVSRMSVDGEDLEIVRTIIALARSLDLAVMAEGVETVDQLAHLRTLGCELGQGFLFSRPVPAAEVGALIAEGGTPMPAFVVRSSSDDAHASS